MAKQSKNDPKPKRLKRLVEETAVVTRRWAETPYYSAVEAKARGQWGTLILPFIEPHKPDMRHVMELAIGHGRMTEILLEHADAVTGVDVLQENLDFCAHRFGEDPKLSLVRNNGVDLEALSDSSVSYVFCFDSMVHFDSDVVRSYLVEFQRIMEPGALAFLHHSNLSRNPGGDFRTAAHARNFMSVPMFSHYAQKEGLSVVKQKVIDWGEGKNRMKDHDGFSLLRKN
jgi:ubiquinone/menaquinone biosynthesis C-methylase UbiE